MPGIPFSELIARYRKVETAAISDAMEPQLSAMDGEIKSVIGLTKIAGPALTVRGYPADELTIGKAIETAQKGDVIVVDARGVKQAALMGGIGFGYCWMKGVEGVVIDGATRDVEELRAYGFPVFARATVPTSAVSASMGQINIPIQCGGVNVNPGDIVVGDVDGVVVVPKAEADRVLIVAEAISDLDEETIRSIKAKVPIDEIKKKRDSRSKEIKDLKERLLGRILETHW
jgi:4-hydroxy-4-methyl-2-oxoglutarate aldolase